MEQEAIERREHHIIDLARVVAATQGEPKPGAEFIRIRGNGVKYNACFECDTHGEYDEGEAQWNALSGPGTFQPECRYCLPARIEAGEVILDRRSAHETLAYMLGGLPGGDEYIAYFHSGAEPVPYQVRMAEAAAS